MNTTAADPHNPPAARTYLQSISCPSDSLCVAGDNQGLVFSSQDPTGGASAWKRITLSGEGAAAFDDISCASVSMCVGAGQCGGRVLLERDPTGDAVRLAP